MNKMLCSVLIITIATVPVFPSYASTILSLELRDGFSYLAAKQVMTANQYQVSSTQEDVFQEKSGYYPHLHLEASSSWTKQIRKKTSLDPVLPEPFTALGDSLFNNSSESTAHLGSLKLNQMLFDNGVTHYKTALAELSVMLATIQSDAELNALKVQFTTLYFEWFKLKNTIAFQKKQIQLEQKEYASLPSTYSPNSAGHIFVLEKRLGIDRAKYSLQRSEAELAQLHLQIRTLLEIPKAQAFELIAPSNTAPPKLRVLEKKGDLPVVRKHLLEAMEAQTQTKLMASLAQYRIDLDGITTMDSYGNTSSYGAIVLRWPLLDGGSTERQIQSLQYAEKASSELAAVAAAKTVALVQKDMDLIELKRTEWTFLNKEKELAALKLSHARAQLQKKLILPIDVEKAKLQLDLTTVSIKNTVLELQKLDTLIALNLCHI